MILDLDATPAPRPPKSARWPVIGIRMDASLATYVREQAYVEHCTVNHWLVSLIRRERDHARLPADVRDWLTIQAAQCGTPGDIDSALIMILRHLADRWPEGARLR